MCKLYDCAYVHMQVYFAIVGINFLVLRESLLIILYLCVANIKTFRKKLAKLSERINNDDSSGQFHWMDSVLVKALREGHWLLISNANFCRYVYSVCVCVCVLACMRLSVCLHVCIHRSHANTGCIILHVLTVHQYWTD